MGATGLVGRAVCGKLVHRGEKVRALVRSTSSAETVAALQSAGAEICVGDLKEPASIAAACKGADAVISTASSTLSRQQGDSIESVDLHGQLTLVQAVKAAAVDRFVFVSFRHPANVSFPLSEAKQAVEHAIQDLDFTIIQASWFMDVWLTPPLGFDYVNATARICGTGTSPISWVLSHDVAEMCALAVRHPSAERKVIEFGGPEALSPLEVVARFERIGKRPFTLEHVPEEALIAGFRAETDPMQKSFAALMLGYARGDAMEMRDVVKTFGLRLASVDDHARAVTGSAATA